MLRSESKASPVGLKRQLRAFLREDRGAIYLSTSFLMATLVIAIPLGIMLMAMYHSLCEGGRQANLMIGLF